MTKFAFFILLLVNFGFMADLAIIPAYHGIAVQFPDASPGVLNFIFSGSQLTALVSTLLCAVFMRHFSKKNIILCGFALFAAGACLGVLIIDPVYVAVMRGVAGFGFGALVAPSIALINEIHRDDKKKAGMLVGFFDGSMAVIGAVVSVIAGFLAAEHWTHSFYQYYAAIPIFILLLIFIPKTPPQKETLAKELLQSVADEKMPWGRVFMLLGSFFMMNLFYCYMTYLSAPYVVETGIGGEVLSGNLGFALSIASGCAGFLFVKTYGFLKRATINVAYLCILAAYLGFSFPPGAFLLYVLYIIMGFGFGTSMSFYYVHAANTVPKSKGPQVFSFIAAAMSIGSFAATYVVTGVMRLAGTESYVAICPIYAAAAGAGFVLSVILAVRDKKLGRNQGGHLSH